MKAKIKGNDAETYAQVVVDISSNELSRPFIYKVPNDLQGKVHVGSIVEVPFGRRDLAGCVVSVVNHCLDYPEDKVKDITRLLQEEPLWLPELLNLARWIKEFYACTWQDGLRTVIPSPVLRKLRRLPKRKLRESGRANTDLTLLSDTGGEQNINLTEEQEEALRKIRGARNRGKGVLLYGVTGSGKTEVYLRLVEEVLQERRQAVVMVPEVALTPQAVLRYRRRFGELVGVLHSGLSDAQRADQWRRMRKREARVALGTRSAVFAPLEDIALFVLDEEHDSSYKQEQTPKYHARQVAIKRAQESNGLVVLGSATPSLESFFLAKTGYYELAELRHRVGGGTLPEVHIVDMRKKIGLKKNAILLSEELRQALGACISAGEQAVLLLNRRGFANYFQCMECLAVPRCIRCSISLTYHSKRGIMLCHYCGYREAPSDECPACGSVRLRQKGGGTERLEQELKTVFPGIKVARMDRDSTRRPGAHTRILEAFASGEVQVLIGTRMVAKGLDFPNVTLVGVLSADGQLHLPDFRASERTFQLITQVAGRSGRGHKPGLVVVQAMEVDNYVLQAACRHDYEGFAERELSIRRQSMYPPFCRLVRILFVSPEEKDVISVSREVGDMLCGYDGFDTLGPAPCPLSRIAGKYRWHILLKGTDVQEQVTVTRSLVAGLARKGRAGSVSVSIDPDPLSLL